MIDSVIDSPSPRVVLSRALTEAIRQATEAGDQLTARVAREALAQLLPEPGPAGDGGRGRRRA